MSTLQSPRGKSSGHTASARCRFAGGLLKEKDFNAHV